MKLDALHDMCRVWRLRLGGLGLEAEGGEELGHGVVGGLGGVVVLGAIEVVDKVAQENEEERPHEHLDGVGCPVEVPDARRRAKAHVA